MTKGKREFREAEVGEYKGEQGEIRADKRNQGK